MLFERNCLLEIDLCLGSGATVHEKREGTPFGALLTALNLLPCSPAPVAGRGRPGPLATSHCRRSPSAPFRAGRGNPCGCSPPALGGSRPPWPLSGTALRTPACWRRGIF